ncbi:hypothetical protein [Bradyrhizobium sp.]
MGLPNFGTWAIHYAVIAPRRDGNGHGVARVLRIAQTGQQPGRVAGFSVL